MLSPIPYDLWPKVVRYEIRLWHEPGTIERVTATLANKGVSVLLAEIVRSGFRYDTWSLTVSFEFLGDARGWEYLEDSGIYRNVRDSLERIEEEIYEKCKDALFVDPHTIDLKVPLQIIPQVALSYFHNFSIVGGKRLPESVQGSFKVRYRSRTSEFAVIESSDFSADVGGDPFRSAMSSFIGDNKFRNVLDYIWTDIEHKERRALTMVSTNASDLNIRVAVIPRNRSRRFFELPYEYSKSGSQITTGLIAYVMSELEDEFNVWHLANFTRENALDREEGSITVVFEDKKADIDSGVSLARAKKVYERLMDRRNLPRHLSGVTPIKVEGAPIVLTTEVVAERFEEEQRLKRIPKYDVFLCHAKEDEKFAASLKQRLERRGLVVFMDTDSMSRGYGLGAGIFEGIQESEEFCIICTRHAIEKPWVLTELGAAWGMRKPIVPITVGMPAEELPELIRGIVAYGVGEVDDYVEKAVVDAGRRKRRFY